MTVEIFIWKNAFGVRLPMAIQRHVRNGMRNVLPRRNARYHEGKEKPNYPVPTIPLEVDWYPDPLIIISETMPVSDRDLQDERYWRGCWRSDGLYGED